MKARKQVQVNEYWKPQPVESPFLRDLSLTYAGQTEGLSLRSTDISSNGMFISTGLRFPEGAILKLRFRLTRTNVEICHPLRSLLLPRRTGLRRKIFRSAATICASHRKRDSHGAARCRIKRQRPARLTPSTQRVWFQQVFPTQVFAAPPAILEIRTPEAAPVCPRGKY